jgi:hypothetical protein
VKENGMDTGQILWGVNTVLLTVIGVGLKMGLNRLAKDFDKMDERIEEKLDSVLCGERHAASTADCEKLFRHRHAPTGDSGRGGEVIIP